jgi:N-acetylglucosaminyldiphosphoundecaprenol N-acetyl-beta-D-mannosaminyltransferase
LNNNKISLLGYDISLIIPEIDSQSITLNTINPHSYCIAKSDLKFKNALKSSDVLLPDGIGIVWACKWLLNKRISKISGSDLHDFMLQYALNNSLKIFYMGSSRDTLEKIKSRINSEYPSLEVGFYSPPFSIEFSTEENSEIISSINSYSPDILFVGMTAPKQEKWVFDNKNKISVNAICCIGAVFDFYSGTIKRPHPFWIKMGLEWFIRLIKEPRRLAQRNFVSTPRFILDTIIEKYSLTKNSRS